MKNVIKIAGFIAVVIAAANPGNAQVLAWDFNGAVGNEAAAGPTTLNANLDDTLLSRGAGIDPSDLSNGFASTGFSIGVTSLSTAISAGDFITFAVSAKSGFLVSLTTLNVTFRRSNTGPNSFQWVHSLDGFNTTGANLGESFSYMGTESNGLAQPSVTLSGVNALQSLAADSVVTFRLYGWGASNAGGTFALGRLSGNDLAVGGVISAIPEPSAGAVILGLGSFAAVGWRRRRRADGVSS